MFEQRRAAMSPTDAKPHILGLGVACLDYLFLAPRAAPGEQAVLRDHLIEGGGLAATALVAAARLGASAELWTWVGDDPEGESVLAGLRREGVNVSAAEVISGARTPVSFIHVEEGTGERTIFHAGRLDPPRSSIAALAQRNLPCDVLLMDATWPEASRLVATQARQQELPVVGDLCPVGAHADLASLATAIIVPGSCAERLAPEASWEDRLRSLARTGASFVAVTAGAEGCYYLDPGTNSLTSLPSPSPW